mgnify:FL=1|tara:strand:- start:76 stop:330 length:255 start_codon:yes stop_codon:yes gene_type:complete
MAKINREELQKEIDAKKVDGNIFNTPMDLRHWAVTLIGYLGNDKTNTLPNTEKVDKLINKFVIDYNYNFTMLSETLPKEETEEE